MNTVQRLGRMCIPALALMLFLSGLAWAITPDEDERPINTGLTITGLLEDDDTDGLTVTTDQGTAYVILTPEEISLEQEKAFHSKYKGQRVTLTGDVYKDEDGTLSLYTTSLPQ